MEELLCLYSNGLRTLPKPYFSSPKPQSSKPLHNLKSQVSLPKRPSKTPKLPSLPPPITSHFEEKMFYLDSIGIDSFSLINSYPPIVSSSLSDIKSTVHFMTSSGFTSIDLRRIYTMCPDILISKVSAIAAVFAFLLREANVKASDLRSVVNRRPRLLACDVEKQLRPTLYFLQMLGITEIHRHASLLSCSVEEKFVPRLAYLEKIGFSQRDSASMLRRFPQLFCYSIKENLEPKFNYFVVEMGRDLKELKDFPHYFSFSLENRIKPRHRMCVERGVCFPLAFMLKAKEERFLQRLEVCVDSSPPLMTSPLWFINSDTSMHFVD